MNPISVLSFRDHVMDMHMERDKAFEREYQVWSDLGKVIGLIAVCHHPVVRCPRWHSWVSVGCSASM